MSTKQETKSHDGTLHGGYSYVDAHGHVQSVKYIADPHHGFQIVSATNLPKAPVHHVAAPVHHAAAYYAAPVASHWGVPAYAHAHGAPLPVQKTHEVLVAEQEHFAAVAEAKARVHHHYKRSAHYGFAPAPVNGVPVDTPEVQHEKAAHFAAVSRALAGQPGHHAAPAYHSAPAYQPHYAPAPVHYNHYAHQPAPAPVNGVPQETAEVAHAKAKHLAAVAEAKSKIGYGGHYSAPAYHSAPAAHHYPIINNGVPQETYEVQAAKAKHFAAVHEAQAKAGHSGHYADNYSGHHEDDGSYDPARYEKESYYH